MLAPFWVDSCPNVVAESLASGTPVICSSTDGTSELVRDGGIIVPEDFELTFKELYNFEQIPSVDIDKYADAVMQVKDDQERYSEQARDRALEDLDIGVVCDRYMQVLEQALQQR